MLTIINIFNCLSLDEVTFFAALRSVVFLVEVTDVCLLKKQGNVFD
jgi:hypothetical protein